MTTQDIVQAQIDYYRARAPEYERSIRDVAGAIDAFVTSQLLALGRFKHALELACGTGMWTQRLVNMAHEVTAIDASPEMLGINARKLGDARVHYRQADLFHWQPDCTYDLVFCAFWLSHVPPDSLDAFLVTMRRAVRAGGCIVIVDQYAPTEDDQAIARDGIYAVRPLFDGRTFTIVKAFHDLDSLAERLKALGLECEVRRLDEHFFFLCGRELHEASSS